MGFWAKVPRSVAAAGEPTAELPQRLIYQVVDKVAEVNGENNRISGAGSDALRLREHIYGEARGHLCIATGKGDRGKKLPRVSNEFFQYPSQAGDAVEHALRASGRGLEAYFCTALLRDGQNRTQENALPLTALFVDGDGARIPPHLPQATATVESSPGKHHFYIRLAEPLERQEFAPLNKRLTYEIGADRGGHGCRTDLAGSGDH